MHCHVNLIITYLKGEFVNHVQIPILIYKLVVNPHNQYNALLVTLYFKLNVKHVPIQQINVQMDVC